MLVDGRRVPDSLQEEINVEYRDVTFGYSADRPVLDHFSLTASETGAYATLLGDEVVDLICTDPPYNVPIDGHVCGSGRIRHRDFAMGVGEMSKAQFCASWSML